jgi:hypothetical protein
VKGEGEEMEEQQQQLVLQQRRMKQQDFRQREQTYQVEYPMIRFGPNPT